MKMKRIRTLSALAVLSLVMLAACSTPNGEPQTNSEPVAPSQVLDFGTLYAQNCAGCHGAQGRGGASIALANPVYLAIVDETTMRNIVANGVRGTSMPAFAQRCRGNADRAADRGDYEWDLFSLGAQTSSRWSQSTLIRGKSRRECRSRPTRVWKILRILPWF